MSGEGGGQIKSGITLPRSNRGEYVSFIDLERGVVGEIFTEVTFTWCKLSF